MSAGITTDASRSLTIDCVRGIAIILAMGWHINKSTGIALVDAVQWPQMHFGWIGVDLFFVLSGFLVGRLIFSEISESGSFDYRRFLMRRIFRLWPVLYLYIFAQLAVGSKPVFTYFFQVLFHVQNYFHTPLKGLWSLAVEEHFYLAAGLILPWLARRKVGRKAYVIGLSVLILTSLLFRIGGVLSGQSSLDLQTYTHFRCDGLAAGVLLALISLERPDVFARIARPNAAYLAVTILCFTLAGQWRETPLGDTLGYTLGMIGSTALILALVNWNPGRQLIWLVRIVAWLGVYSYSIYIWHFPFANTGEKFLVDAGVDTPWILLAAQYIFAISGSLVISKLLEMPMIRLRNRLFPSNVHALAQSSK